MGEDYAATCCAIQNFMLSMWIEGVGTKWTSGDITRTQDFADSCGIDVEAERVVGCIWYGFAGWCVVTSRRSNDCKVLEMEDYAATCCAIQNFMLSMWIEGVGTKWTSGDITRTQG